MSLRSRPWERRRWLIPLATWVLYFASWPLLNGWLGSDAHLLGVLPIAAAALAWGVRGGLLGSLLLIGLNFILLRYLGAASLAAVASNDHVMEALIEVVVGVVLGWLATELHRKQAASAELADARSRLASTLEVTARQARELELVHQLRDELDASLEVHELCRLAVDAVKRWLGYYQVSTYLVEDGVLILQHQVGYGYPLANFPLTQGVAGRTARTGVPAYLSDVREDADYRAAVDGILSEICVPLWVAGKTVGIINVESNEERLEDGDFALIQMVARLLSSALERATLHQELLAESERRAAVLYASPDPIVVIRPDSTIEEWSPAAERVFGWPRSAVLGRNAVGLLIPEASRDAVVARGRPLAGSAGRAEFRLLRRDGTTVPIEATITLADPGGERRYIVGMRELSDREEAELARRESAAKSRLLAAISHEIRTPLNAVLGFAQLLLTEKVGPLNEKQRRYLGNIESSGSLLVGVLNDALDHGKVAAGQLIVESVPLPLEPVTTEVVARFQARADAAGVKVRADVPAGLAVRADPLRLNQVLSNLVSNAIKFTEPGGKVVIRVRRRGEAVDIAVADTGIGIPAARLDSIFDEYTQVTESGHSTEGTGLGLSLVRGLVDLMGGTVQVESALGEGSTFTVCLPVADPIPVPA